MGNNVIEGYKVFNPDWTCRGKQYTCPGKFEESGKLSICGHGMHFCKVAVDCFNYYRFSPNNKVAKVIAYGDIKENDDKCCTNKLEIVREIPWAELLEIVNMGKGCAGLYNRGNYNSGNYNTGDCNTGDWNKTNFSNGCFNTFEPKIYLFNKPSGWTYSDWVHSEAHYFMNPIPRDRLNYVQFPDMTAEEKKEHPEAEVTGGYLKTIKTTNEQRQKWWDNLSHDNKEIIKNIPNFDNEIFKEITGIDVEQ